MEEQQLIHPVAGAGDGLAGHVIANGSAPLASGVGVNLATGVVVGHGESKDVGHVGDPLRLQESAAVAKVGMQNVAAVLNDEVLEALPARQVLTRADGDMNALAEARPTVEVFHLEWIFEPYRL